MMLLGLIGMNSLGTDEGIGPIAFLECAFARSVCAQG